MRWWKQFRAWLRRTFTRENLDMVRAAVEAVQRVIENPALDIATALTQTQADDKALYVLRRIVQNALLSLTIAGKVIEETSRGKGVPSPEDKEAAVLDALRNATPTVRKVSLEELEILIDADLDPVSGSRRRVLERQYAALKQVGLNSDTFDSSNA